MGVSRLSLPRPHICGFSDNEAPPPRREDRVQTGNNTVFGYLAKPITKTFGNAMEER